LFSATTQFGLLWLLCIGAACALAASVSFTYRRLAGPLLLFVAVLVLAGGIVLPWSPSNGEVAAIVGCVCAWQLLRPLSPAFAPLAAGLCTGLGAIVQMQQGAPLAVSGAVAAILAGSAVLAGKRVGFAPARIVEQALTGLVLAAPVIGVLPGIVSGWQSAVTINLPANARVMASFPAWVWQFVVAMLVLGVLRELWVRR
jgi:hypothetical protein